MDFYFVSPINFHFETRIILAPSPVPYRGYCHAFRCGKVGRPVITALLEDPVLTRCGFTWLSECVVTFLRNFRNHSSFTLLWKTQNFAFLILSHSDSFVQLITPNPVLAVKCSLFHYATCFGPVDGQQLIVLKFLSDGTVVACSELTSLLLYCCIILGVCCTLTACHSSAPVGTSWLISVGILSFFPEDGTAGPKHVGVYQV